MSELAATIQDTNPQKQPQNNPNNNITALFYFGVIFFNFKHTILHFSVTLIYEQKFTKKDKPTKTPIVLSFTAGKDPLQNLFISAAFNYHLPAVQKEKIRKDHSEILWRCRSFVYAQPFSSRKTTYCTSSTLAVVSITFFHLKTMIDVNSAWVFGMTTGSLPYINWADSR